MKEISGPFEMLSQAIVHCSLFEGNELFPLLKSSFTCVQCQQDVNFIIEPYKTGFSLYHLYDKNFVSIDCLLQNNTGVLSKSPLFNQCFLVVDGLQSALYVIQKCKNCCSDYLIVFGIDEIQNGRTICKISGVWKIRLISAST
jgi:hypothetical protein